MIESLHPDAYHALMDMGFRRSGRVLYRPQCEGCQACVPLRVPVATFTPTRSQRRVWRRNQDLRHVVTSPPVMDDARADLYLRYLAHQHEKTPADSAERLEGFLYTTCVDTLEVSYLDPSGALIGVSILDRSAQSLSSVYHFFAPEARERSVGVFSVLFEIELCKEWGIPYYYLGFWVDPCKAMTYKATYQPFELLTDGVWRTPTPATEEPA
jgi:arginyl-tRNA--protein-N-Asp/Glu arginylyltransferase